MFSDSVTMFWRIWQVVMVSEIVSGAKYRALLFTGLDLMETLRINTSYTH